VVGCLWSSLCSRGSLRPQSKRRQPPPRLTSPSAWPVSNPPPVNSALANSLTVMSLVVVSARLCHRANHWMTDLVLQRVTLRSSSHPRLAVLVQVLGHRQHQLRRLRRSFPKACMKHRCGQHRRGKPLSTTDVLCNCMMRKTGRSLHFENVEGQKLEASSWRAWMKPM
jgi:hypothetical protein